MMKRNLYTIVILILSGYFSGFSQSARPNVLILYTDQHQADAMGFMGHPDVLTPNLDRLAKSGIVFTRAYCQNAICTPSRSAMMSGVYPRTLGALNNQDRSSVMNEVVSMATVFKQNGYKTYAFGKRHTPQAIDAGWDIEKSHIYQESPGESYVDWIKDRGLEEEFAMDWAAEFGRGPDGSGPHQPYTPQKRFLGMYDASGWGEGTRHGGKIKMPESLREPAEHLPPVLARQRGNENGITLNSLR